ncbi:type I polyketide synthase, partial [Streptomyces olindensis]
TIPVISNLTGTPATPHQHHDPTYWTHHIRQPVHFHQGITHLTETEHITLFTELGGHPTLTPHLPTTTHTTRHQPDETHTHLTTLTTLHTHHHRVDLTPHLPSRPQHDLDLPTYPFQHQPYWLQAPAQLTDATDLGLTTTRHPLLSTATQLANTHHTVLSGRISLRTHPWLADHAVSGTVLLPGTALVDLALHAGDHAGGAAHLDELTLHAPLVLDESASRDLQVTAIPDTDTDGWSVTIHSRPDDTEPWTCHATGTLTTTHEPARPLTHWPPTGARPVDVSDLYDRLAASGYEYGPTFQGATAAWTQPDGTFHAEITLPQTADPAGHTIHPALLDAALHPLATRTTTTGETQLPFAWTGVTVHATDATHLRATLTTTDNGITVQAWDPTGAPLATVNTLTTRPIDPTTLHKSADAATRNSLFHLTWKPAETGSQKVDPDEVDVYIPHVDEDSESPTTAHAASEALLAHLQSWLAANDATDRRLVVVTRHAVATSAAEVTYLAHAPLWGLTRTAQNEHPGRIHLIDTDDPTDTSTLTQAVATGEPQLAHRNGQLLTPRLTRTTTPTNPTPQTLDPNGTVLITGGTGGLATLTAHHLITTHGTRHLLLASRTAPQHTQLREELEALGAEVTLAACDITDPQAVEELIASIPEDHPLTAVIHTAGTLDDTTLTSLTPDRLHPVLAPKVDAAWNLHQATRRLDLAAFVLYSSAAGTLGNPGQANYAAANTYLDALAHHRHHHGQPATSLAWGYWKHTTGLTHHLTGSEVRKVTHGTRPLETDHALHLFDTALATSQPHQLCLPLNLATLRTADHISPLLRDLAPANRRTTAAARPTDTDLSTRLRSLPPELQEKLVLEVVCAGVAAVLGHGGAEAIDPQRPFNELGFDSLTAVQLRNRLAEATALRLTSTLIFDYPTPSDLARYVGAALGVGEVSVESAFLAEIDRLEQALTERSEDDPGRAKVTRRLQTLLSRLNENGRPTTNGEDIEEKLRSASNEELFDLIDGDLDLS